MRADEHMRVRALGDEIGYGRTMQLCEQIWSERQPGMAIATYCCVLFLVRCPACTKAGNCDWCCGAGRVTERVARAINELKKP